MKCNEESGEKRKKKKVIGFKNWAAWWVNQTLEADLLQYLQVVLIPLIKNFNKDKLFG